MSEPLPTVSPMPFRLILDEAMRWARRHFRVIYPPIAVPLAVLVTLTGVAQAIWLGPAAFSIAANNPEIFLRRLGLYLLFALPLLMIAGLAHAALQVAAVDAVSGRGPNMGHAWRFVIRPSSLGTLTLQGLSLMGAAFCCFLPILYVGPLLGFVIAAMTDEGKTGTAALSRSAELTRYNPERRFLSSPIVQILVVFVLTAILEYAVSFVVALPVSAAQMYSIFRRAAAGGDLTQISSGWLWAQVVVQLVTTLLNAAVTLYTSFVLALLFFEVRRRREATDLRGAIDAMAPALPPPPPPPLPTP